MSATIHPPVLDSTLPGTPSHEWANNTNNALHPAFNSSSSASTPGIELPGAFPRNRGTNNATASDIGDTIVDTARTYLPNGVANTIENYLGKGPGNLVCASQNDTVHQKSLPTQELMGQRAGEKTDGAGSLPGIAVEQGVARLPDERNAEFGEKSHTMEGYAAVAKEKMEQASPVAASAAGALGIPVGAGLLAKDHQNVSLPSQETSGTQPGEHVGGVGALPGGKGETGVAVLPHERSVKMSEGLDNVNPNTIAKAKEAMGQVKQKDFSIKRIDHEQPTVPASGSDSTGVKDAPAEGLSGAAVDKASDQGPVIHLEPRIYPLGSKETTFNDFNVDREGVEKWERSHASPLPSPSHKELPEKPDAPKKKDDANIKDRGDGYHTDYHPAELHPLDTSKVPDENKSKSKNEEASQHSSEKSGSPTSPHKTTFKERITGGSKILMGKVGHNNEKVEEGRKILHGEA